VRDCARCTRPITRVALYARVSTLNNQDPEMQLAELREYACRRGWQIVEEFTDQGVSGCKESRPALNRLMADACRRRFDAILVWKIDRFGRSLKHLVNALAELAALGVAFISLRDNLDLSTPSGRLMFQIIGAMAEFERALIQERVRAGLRNARAKGRRLGRPRVIVDAPRIASLRTQGHSWSQKTTCAGVGQHTRVRQSTAAKKEGGSLVRGTEESDRIAALASAETPVRARAVLPGRGSSEHQATGALPQSADNTDSAGYHVVDKKTRDGMLADEKPFC
jgi:DNA invertase Pin-like site-specific DNA recombinase